MSFYHLIVFYAVWIVESSLDEVDPAPNEVKSHYWSKMVCICLYVTNNNRSRKGQNEVKKDFGWHN